MQRVMPHVLTALVLGLGVLAWWHATLGLQAFTWETYRRLEIQASPVPVPAITLQDHAGRAVDIAALRGKVVAVNFIYTRCPTICGYTGLAYAKLHSALAQRGLQDSVQLLSISLQPQFDTPRHLTQYLQRFTKELDGGWLAARPRDVQQGRILLARLGVVSIPDGMGGITHNAATHIIDQQGRLVRILDEDRTDETLHTLVQLLAGARAERNAL